MSNTAHYQINMQFNEAGPAGGDIVKVFNNYGDWNFVSGRVLVLGEYFGILYVDMTLQPHNTYAVYKGLERPKKTRLVDKIKRSLFVEQP